MVGVEEEGSCCEVEQRMRKEEVAGLLIWSLWNLRALIIVRLLGRLVVHPAWRGFEGEQILACDAWNCTFCLSSSSCSFLIFSLVFQRIFHCKMDHSCKGFVQSELDTSSIHSLE